MSAWLADGSHGGPGPDKTLVPFWLFGAGQVPKGATLQQTKIAGTVCTLMDMPHGGMAANPALL